MGRKWKIHSECDVQRSPPRHRRSPLLLPSTDKWEWLHKNSHKHFDSWKHECMWGESQREDQTRDQLSYIYDEHKGGKYDAYRWSQRKSELHVLLWSKSSFLCLLHPCKASLASGNPLVCMSLHCMYVSAPSRSLTRPQVMPVILNCGYSQNDHQLFKCVPFLRHFFTGPEGRL